MQGRAARDDVWPAPPRRASRRRIQEFVSQSWASSAATRPRSSRERRIAGAAALPRINAAAVMDDATIRQFNDDGAVLLKGLAAPAWVDALREGAEE